MNRPAPSEFVGIGMTDKDFVDRTVPAHPHLAAVEALNQAVHLLIAAHYDQFERLHHIAAAVGHTSDALGYLGYDVVRRLTPQEAHEAAIERRVAEDGPPDDGIHVNRIVPRQVGPDDRDFVGGR